MRGGGASHQTVAAAGVSMHYNSFCLWYVRLQQSKICVRFVKCKGSDDSPPHAKIEASRDIEEGEEVYISYGEVFWRAKGGMH